MTVFAQETEVQLKEKADKLFEKQDYVLATTAYLQLLALQPRNPEYNYKYGTCLLFNSRKKQDAIKYLEFATASGSIDLEAFYYMGKAYHLNYQFEEAIKFYNLYKTNSRGKTNKELEVERQIEMCENGRKLLKNITDIIVLEKKEYFFNEFFKLYDLKDFGGDILVSTTEQSKLDKKKGHTPIIHFPPNAQKVFFASYGDNEANGKQIYVKRKLKEGGWSVPELVKGEVNTKYDEDFPYLDPSGTYLYFSSKGHNSMGGFDVFKSKYDAATNSFGLPENVDFAISSADNDLFYIVDSLDQNAWFASSRQSDNGKISVYKVRVERLAAPIAAIVGTFSSTVHPENKKFNIEVKDLTSGRQMGTFYSQNDGSYLIALPKGGKYEYSIKITGSPKEVFKAVVNVPLLNEFKPLKQKILHEEENSKEMVKVINLFDQEVENAERLLAEIVQLRSELNVNASQFDLQSLGNSGSKEVFADLGLQRLSPLEARDKVLELAKSQTSQVKTIEDLQQKAIGKILENTAAIKSLQTAFKNTVNETNTTSDPAEKYGLFLEADKKSAEITALEQANRKLLKYSDSLSQLIQAKNTETVAAKKLEQQLVQASDETQIAKVISDNKSQIKNLQAEGNILPAEKLVQEILKLKSEKDQLNTSRNSYQNTVNGLQKEIELLENKLASAKVKDKPSIQSSIDSKKNEMELVNQEMKSLDKKIEKIVVQLDQKEGQLEFLQNVQKEKLPTKTLAAADAKKAVESTESQNYKTLKSYVAQQKTELEKNPALANRETGNGSENPSVNEPAVLERMSPNYEEKLTQIENNQKLTEEERLQLAQKEDQNLKAKVQQEMERVNKAIQQNPSDSKAQEELKSLQSIHERLENRMEERKETIAGLSEKQTNTKQVSADVIIKEIKPDLDKRLDKIANDPNLSVIEQLKMAQNEELEFEQILGEEISALESKIEKDPSDQVSKKQLQSLQSLKKQVAENIDNRSLAIESLDPDGSVVVDKPSKPEVMTQLKPDHETKLAAIQSNPDLSVKEKLQQAQNEDEKLKTTINAEVKRLQAVLQKNPNDARSQAEYELLLEIQQDVNQRIEERKTALEIPETVSVPETNVETSPDVIARVKPDHEQKLAAISKDDLLSPQEKQSKLIQEEAKLQKALDAEIKKTDKILAKNPADEKSITAKEQLMVSREQSQNRMDESRQFLVADAKTEIKPVDLLAKTDKSYQVDVQKIENSDAPDETQQLVAREKISQQTLQMQIAKNEAQLAKKDNAALEAENQVLSELVDASQKRIETLSGNSGTTESENPEVIDMISVRKANLGTNQGAVTDNLSAPEDLKKQLQVLETYQKDLQTLISESEKLLLEKPSDKNLLAERELYRKEEKVVQEKLREVSTKLEKIEKNAPVAVKNPESTQNPDPITETGNQKTFDHPDLRELEREKSVLEAKLTDPAVSEREKQAVRKEIATNENKQTKIENSLIEEKINDQALQTSTSLKTAEKQVSTTEDARKKELATIQGIQKSEQTIAVQLKEAQAQKNPAAKQEILNQVLAQQLENEEKLSQLRLDQALNRSVEQLQEKDPEMTIYKLESTKDLQSRRRTGTIEFGELTSEIEHLNEEIKSSSRAKAKVLIAERDAKMNEQIALQHELMQIETELTKRNEKPLSVYNEAAISESITYVEERKIASSEPYKKYTKTAEEAAVLKKSIQVKEEKLEILKSENHLLIVKDVEQSSTANQAKTQQNLSSIVSLTQEIEADKQRLSAKKQEADQIINESEDAMKLQNLIARGVEPIKTLAVASALIPLPSNGFEIVSNPRTAPVKTNIPVGVDVPSGLVYRVQVGAFAKPVKEELFKEFNPVSGEKLNSGITRYMAGYFNNRAAVLNARTEIQNLGYSDAFPVAYCDGQRISMQEARRLEESGQCVALGVESMVMEASVKVTQTVSGDPTVKAVIPAESPGAYNQAPGAAKAIAVENRPGLFYTVQIGVYNKPVPASQIKNMEPLITKRLANGQIRYSAGIFQSVEGAQPKRREAVARGINDAFITAYYKGERISLEEARKLLAELGSEILEKENPKENKVIPDEKIRQIEAERVKTTSKIEQKERVENQFKEDQIQFVSKDKYEVFPRDLLRRFNENGSFFYDIEDQKIKSIVYKNEDYVPQVYYFRKEIDTVFLAKSDSLHKEGTFQIAARFQGDELTGEMGEWLIRLGYQREIKHVEDNKIQVRVFGIRDEATFDKVMAQMRMLGFNVLMAGGF